MMDVQELQTLAISRILEHEGGYVDDPDDRGGETKFGISKRAYPQLNISDLQRGDAVAIYRKDYWVAIELTDLCMLANPTVTRRDLWAIGSGLAIVILDHAVNTGPGNAIETLQHLIGTTVDGVVGPKTINAMHEWIENGSGEPEDYNCRINEYTRARIEYYVDLAQFDRYGTGWLNRVISMHNTAIDVAIANL